MNEKRKLQHEFYEFCKTEEFYNEIKKEVERIKKERDNELLKLKQQYPNKTLNFKSSPLNKINPTIVFQEFYKVVKKKSELPRAQRELVYIIGMKVLQKLRP